MRNWLIVVGVASAAAAACGGGVKGSEAPLAPVEVRVVKVEAGQVPQVVELYGTVEAERTAAVSSRVMATVTAVQVQPGDVGPGRAGAGGDRPRDGARPGGAGARRARPGAGGAHARRAQPRALQGAGRPRAPPRARARHGAHAVRAGQGRGRRRREGAVEAASSVARESKVVAPFAGRVAAKLVEVGDLAAPGPPAGHGRVGDRAGGSCWRSRRACCAAAGLKVGAPSLPVRIDAPPGAGERDGRGERDEPGRRSDVATRSRSRSSGRRRRAAGAAGRAGDRRRDPVRRWPCRARRSSKSGGLDLVVVRDAQGLARSRAVTLGGAARRRPGRGPLRPRRRRGGARSGSPRRRPTARRRGGAAVSGHPRARRPRPRRNRRAREALRLKMTRRPLGAAGRIAQAFLDSKLTPLLVVFSLLLGVFAVLVTPREEEPQIKVPMIDVLVALPRRHRRRRSSAGWSRRSRRCSPRSPTSSTSTPPRSPRAA